MIAEAKRHRSNRLPAPESLEFVHKSHSFAAIAVPETHIKRRLIVDLVVRGFLTVMFAVIDHALGDHIGMVVTRFVQTVLVLCVAAVLCWPHWSSRMSQALATMASIIWSAGLVWGLQFLSRPEEDMDRKFANNAAVVLVMEFLSMELRPRIHWACIACHLASCATFVLVHGDRMCWFYVVREFPMLIALFAIVLQVIFNRQDICNQLVVEQNATKALVKMTSDAGFWVGADGDTIVRSDKVLDGLMGMEMENVSLTSFLNESDRDRFRLAIKDRLKRLLPVTVQSPEAPFQAELFIVATTGRNAASYLIGLKLNDREDLESSRAPHYGHCSSLAAEDDLEEAVGRSVTQRTTWDDVMLEDGTWDDVMLEDAEAKPCALSADLLGKLEDAEELQAVPFRKMSGSKRRTRFCDAEPEGAPWGLEAACSLVSCSSYPATMASGALQPIQVDRCNRKQMLDQLLAATAAPNPHFGDTLQEAVSMICDHATGGALVLLADKEAFATVFSGMSFDRKSTGSLGTACTMRAASSASTAPTLLQATSRTSTAPMLQSSDGGYMTARLHRIHISDERFKAAFNEFSAHSDTDRWPEDHSDEAARGLPKDGAFLLDLSGFRLKCAVKVVGLPSPPQSWPGTGTRHGAALACAWAVKGCIALVRSDCGSVHIVVRHGATLRAYGLNSEQA